MDIAIKVEVPIGHRLYGYPGKCAHAHGHNYNIEFWINGNPDAELGLVMDFKDLKSHVDLLLDPFDHAMVLMDGDPLEDALLTLRSKHIILNVNPSAENLCSLLFNQARDLEGLRVSKIVIQETSDSYATTDRVSRDVRVLRGVR